MTRRRSLLVGAAIVGAAAIVSGVVYVQGDVHVPRSGGVAVRRDGPPWAQFDHETVAVALPAANEVALIDPEGLAAWRLASLSRTGFRSAVDLAYLDGSLVALDLWRGALTAVDLRTEEVRTGAFPVDSGPSPVPGIVREPRVTGGRVAVGSRGEVLVSLDEGPRRGRVLAYQLGENEPFLDVGVGPGQVGATVDGRGRLWTIGAEAGGSVGGPSVSIVDIAGEQVNSRLLHGIPRDIAPGPRDSMFITLYDRDDVLEIGPDGRIRDRLQGLPAGPWGIAIEPSGRGIVVSEGNPDTGNSVSLVDFERMEVERTLRVLDECPIPREVVVVKGRAVVTCVGVPGVMVLDLANLSVLAVLPLGRTAPETSGGFVLPDEPRGLVVVPPPSHTA